MAYDSLKDKNIAFLQGSQTNLNSLITNGGATEGAFYLTEDTHRLYIGRKEGEQVKPVAVNEGVVTVANISSLPATANTGEFYYATEENVLCVKSGENWVQINPDTNTDTWQDTAVTAAEFTPVWDKTTDNDVTFTLKLTNTQTNSENEETSSEVSASFTIAGADLLDILNINVGLTSTAITNGAKLSTNGVGANTTEGVAIVGSGATTVSRGSDGTITISSANDVVTTLKAENNALVYKDESNSETSISLSGDDIISLTADSTNGIKAAHKTYTLTANEDSAETLPYSGGKITAVTGVTTDAHGHTTAITTKEFNLPDLTYELTAPDTANENGNVFVTLIRGDNDEVQVDLQKQIYYKIGDHAASYTNGSSLPVYTKEEVDNQLKGLNALTYRGIVDASHALPTSNVAIGDVYKVNQAGTYGGVYADLGDLLIAKAKDGAAEGEDGYLAAEDIEWTVITSGDEVDTQYSLSVIEGGLLFKNDTTSDETQIPVNAGKNIAVTYDNGINIAHAEITTKDTEATATAEHGKTISAITGIVSDNGHITDITTTTYTLPEDKDTTYELSGEVAVSNDTLTHTITLSDGVNETSSTLVLGSSSLKIEQTEDNNNTINLVWGSF